MTNFNSYGTLAGSTYTLHMSPDTDKGERPKTPSGLIVTRAIETKDGWRGQVIVDKEIVFEGYPINGEEAGEHAIREANRCVVLAVKKLFVESTDDPDGRG